MKKKPKHFGYKAKLDDDVFIIIAVEKKTLRRLHGILFPWQKFKAKLCHPAKFSRVKP